MPTLRPDQLAADLTQRLRPVYALAGDEPLLIQEALDAIRVRARAAGASARVSLFTEPGSGFRWADIQAALAERSLFDDGTLVELNLPRGPGAVGKGGGEEAAGDGAKALALAVERASAVSDGSTVLVIVCGPLDWRARKAAWWTQLEDKAMTVYAWPITAEELPRWLAARATLAGVKLSPEALLLLTERTEGHLLAAVQDLARLALLHGPDKIVNSAELAEAVAEAAHFEPFDWVEKTLSGRPAVALKALESLRVEGLALPELLRAMGFALRQALAAAAAHASSRDPDSALLAAGLRPPRAGAYRRALDRWRWSAPRIEDALGRLGDADAAFRSKWFVEAAWEDLASLTASLAGLGVAGRLVQASPALGAT